MKNWKALSKWCIPLGAALLAMLAVACGAAEQEQPVPTPTSQAATQPTQPSSQPTAVAPTATPVAASTQPTGGLITNKPKVTLAAGLVGQMVGDPSTAPYAKGVGPGDVGIRDYLFYHDGQDPMAPLLAKSWAMSPDRKKFVFEVKEGIKFNTPNLADTQGMDFGEFTAEDVAWYINRHNPSVNKETIAGDGGQIATYFGECSAVEKYVVECVAVNPSFFGLPLSQMIILDAGPAVESKKAFELLGPDKVKDIAVGTGPMVQGEWIANERGTLHAVADHWFKTAAISTFTMVQVPEVTTRIAMLETNEADLAEMDFAKVKDLRSKGLDFLPTMQERDTENASVIWPGNLWEKVHARTGEPLEPWKSPVYAQDYPWIGNPWPADLVPYKDTDNPSGMSDMEQARLVRWALSYAIDREGIVEALQSGLGTPIYIEYMGPLYPGWDPNRTVDKARADAIIQKHGCSLPVNPMTYDQCPTYNVPSPRASFGWPWEIPYDKDMAEELLDLAGYPRKSGGVRFEISLNKYRCETGDVCLEQADAVATAWEQIGVKTTLLTEDYGAVVSQRMRTREQFWPVVKNCSVESANTPLDWPMPPADSSLTRPGWGCAFEDPFSALMQNKITFEPDKAKREEWHLDVVDWMYYWQLYSGVAQQPRGVAYNPKRISKWTAPSSQGPSWHRPEYILPAAQ